MFFGYSRQRDNRAAHERGWRRAELVAREAKWRRLSPPARLAFITEAKSPIKKGRSSYTVRPNRFPPEVLEELRAAGFVEVVPPGQGSRLPAVNVPDDMREFAHYLRSLYRFRLLDPARPSALTAYTKVAFDNSGLWSVIHDVTQRAGIRGRLDADAALERYIVGYRWPGWAVTGVTERLAQPVLDALRDAAAPLTLPELAARLKVGDETEVRAALDRLIARLAVFEDLRPQTWEVVFGLLPSVRQGLSSQSITRGRPALRPCARPREVAPEGGWLVNALRAFLLEVAAEPPRLKKGGEIFQKEEERLLAALGSVPAWLNSQFNVTVPKQLSQAVHWANSFGYTKKTSAQSERRLQLTERGRQWLASAVERQYAALYKAIGTLPGNESESDLGYYYYSGGDMRFLGDDVRVTTVAPRSRPSSEWWRLSAIQIRALRRALHEVLGALQPGQFYDLESVLAHLTFGPHNPLLLGHQPADVQIIFRSYSIASLDEEIEQAARHVLDTFIKERLLPFGAVQAGVDDAGRPVIARLPRLDAYFGDEVAASEMAGPAVGAARVVVQPDFSVTIIGLNPAPAAELAPFCERVRGHAGEGALILRITRDSVVKAVTNGLAAPEVLARLKRHATTPVPPNVLREVSDWCAWVREVTVAPVLVIRCPDKDTADRVLSALGKHAERLTETLVAFTEEALSTADRNKLLKHGIVVRKKR